MLAAPGSGASEEDNEELAKGKPCDALLDEKTAALVMEMFVDGWKGISVEPPAGEKGKVGETEEGDKEKEEEKPEAAESKGWSLRAGSAVGSAGVVAVVAVMGGLLL